MAKIDVCTAGVPQGMANSGAEITRWYGNQSRRVIQGVALHFTLRVTHENGAMPDTFELVVHSSYMVVYDIVEMQVRILNVVHTAQQWLPLEG